MCSSRKIICSLLVLSTLEIGLGVSSIALGAVGISRARPYKSQQGDASPVWSGFLLCGLCGVLCAKRRTGLIMTLFSACCICGLISGILNFQFVRALTKRPQSHRPLQLVAMTVSCLGVACSTLSTWLTCRLAGTEQQRMFMEREHSMHHSHELAEKNVWHMPQGEECMSCGEECVSCGEEHSSQGVERMPHGEECVSCGEEHSSQGVERMPHGEECVSCGEEHSSQGAPGNFQQRGTADPSQWECISTAKSHPGSDISSRKLGYNAVQQSGDGS